MRTQYSRGQDYSRPYVAEGSVANGKVTRLNTSGKMELASASSAATASGQLAISAAYVGDGARGEFLEHGEITLSGLTQGSTYYLSETPGEITTTPPSDPGTIVRIVGVAASTTVLKFNPDQTTVEN